MISGKNILITGASRGIGKEIAKKMAYMGNNIIVAAKTLDKHEHLEGSILETAKECVELGGKALPIKLDIRNEYEIQEAITKSVDHFGGIDILINNASAIDNSNTGDIMSNKYDLIHSVNGRGTFLMTKHSLPHLLKSENPHVLNMSPPIDLNPKWFKLGGTAYTMSKYNMSMCSLGMSEEYKNKIAFNCLWPKTLIATAAVNMIAGKAGLAGSRKAEIVADAASWIISQDKSVTGKFFIDEDILTKKIGISKDELKKYNNSNSILPLIPDIYVGDPDYVSKYMNFGKIGIKIAKILK
jgi:citronellol/citronellal dehydrogenase